MASGAMVAAQRRMVSRRGVIGGCAVALVLLLVGFHFVSTYWPYRYRMVQPTLQEVFASKIKMAHYRRTYWPHPGFVAEGLTLRRNTAPDLPPVGSVDRVRVEGSWLDLLLFRNRIVAVYADGLHVVIPPVGSRANQEDFPAGSSNDFEGPDTAVGRFVMRNAVLDILRTDGSRYTFPIKQLVITNLQKNAAVGYSVEMATPQAVGQLRASGSFGPLVGGKLDQTRVTGRFTYEDVKLDGISDLHGVLTTKGSFEGNLGGIEGRAEGSVADFRVGEGKGVGLSGSATGAVDALNGNIALQGVDVKVGRTVVHVVGQIVGAPKVTDLEVSVASGRTQDLLRPFMRAQPPVAGPVRLHGHAHIAAAEHAEGFLERFTMKGAFEIPKERLTDSPTEKSLTAFSQRAQGVPDEQAAAAADEQDVLSSLVGNVVIAKGVVHGTQLVFVVPGASIEGSGTFDLASEKVDITGDLRMQADLPHATTGFKSFLLKPLAPFFRKKHAGAVVPVRVTGGPGHYTIGQNVLR
ncbi:MAG TPA: AsmA-like C-terminal region-containing protein [Acidobacteriaceae bacterium]|nr:AsmA-like C-terminal region-containing protein [Acidobacteriaceae bacterium]